MQNSARTWTILAVIVIAILGAIALWQHRSTTSAPGSVATSTISAPSATTTKSTTTGTTATTPIKGGTVTVTSGTLQGGASQATTDQEYALLAQGQTKKNAGDYRGAAAIWETVALSNTFVSFIAYANLADLYMNFIRDYPQAEVDLKQVITLKPDYIDAYRNLYALYTVYGYKTGTSAAADIVAQGLKANPNNPDLLKMQAQLNTQTQ